VRKVWREDTFKPANRNESLHGSSNDNGVRVVNFATLKIYNCQDHNVHTLQRS